jgi:predicted HTH transcriptional regulator
MHLIKAHTTRAPSAPCAPSFSADATTCSQVPIPGWQPWLVYFLRALQQQMKRLARKVERERIVLATMPELSVQILEYAREHGRVTIGDIVRLTGTSRNTLKRHFRQLQGKGQLVLHGQGRGAWYALA